jgi:hypothetical protein
MTETALIARTVSFHSAPLMQLQKKHTKKLTDRFIFLSDPRLLLGRGHLIGPASTDDLGIGWLSRVKQADAKEIWGNMAFPIIRIITISHAATESLDLKLGRLRLVDPRGDASTGPPLLQHAIRASPVKQGLLSLDSLDGLGECPRIGGSTRDRSTTTIEGSCIRRGTLSLFAWLTIDKSDHFVCKEAEKLVLEFGLMAKVRSRALDEECSISSLSLRNGSRATDLDCQSD